MTERQQQEKQTYEAPALFDYGSIRELTEQPIGEVSFGIGGDGPAPFPFPVDF